MTFPFNAHPDYEFYGFDRTEFEQFLNAHGKSLNGQEAASMAAQTYPAWGKDFIGIDRFSMRECASMLCGMNPMAGGWMTDEEVEAHAIALRQLQCAIGNGEIDPAELTPDGDPVLNSEAVRLWCPTVRRTWPIPPRQETAAPGVTTMNDAPLLEKLRDAERRCADAEARLKAQGNVIDTTNELRQQLADAQATAAKLEAEKNRAEAEIDILKADIASGKGKSTMLKLIGGLAMAGAELDIHSDRIIGISEVVDTLASKGVSISEDTLRARLKEAAEVIEPNQK